VHLCNSAHRRGQFRTPTMMVGFSLLRIAVIVPRRIEDDLDRPSLSLRRSHSAMWQPLTSHSLKRSSLSTEVHNPYGLTVVVRLSVSLLIAVSSEHVLQLPCHIRGLFLVDPIRGRLLNESCANTAVGVSSTFHLSQFGRRQLAEFLMDERQQLVGRLPFTGVNRSQ